MKGGRAGYSGTPLAKKLGIRDGDRVLLLGGPADLADSLSPLPPGARLEREALGLRDAEPTPSGGRYDVVVLFCPDVEAAGRHLRPTVHRLTWAGGLWACWPKKSSPLHVDLSREKVREVGLATGLVDNKVCAVDDDWSGLRFVVRAEDRPPSMDEGGPTP